MAESPEAIDTFSYAAPDDPRLKRFVIRLIERISGQPYLKWLYEDNRSQSGAGRDVLGCGDPQARTQARLQ